MDLKDNVTCSMENSWLSDCNEDPLKLTVTLLKSLALGVIILLTISGNILVLMAVALSPNLRSSTHYLIVNLAVADLLLGTTVLPFSAAFEITGKWYFGQTFCSIWASVDVLCCTSSILSLCVISLDRYIGVTRPLAYSTIMVGRRTSILIVLIWASSVAISIGPLLGWKEPPSENPYDCTINKQLGYVLFSVTGSFYLPMLIILIVYWKIYKAAIRQTKFLECGTKTTKQDVTLRIHLGGANGRANSTPDLGVAIVRGGGAAPKNECPAHCITPQKNLAPLAPPEISSSSSHNEEYQNDPGVVLRVHRGGSKRNAHNGDANWTCLAARNQRQSRCRPHQHHNQNNFNAPQPAEQPNSLTPSPPSSSPERKINPGFGKIAKFRRQKKAAKTLAIVVGVFLFCWLPFFFILPLVKIFGCNPDCIRSERINVVYGSVQQAEDLHCAVCSQCKVPDKIFDLFFWLGYFNSCLNPIIYSCTSREFQRAFRRILCRRIPQRPHLSRAIYRANMQNRYVDRNCNGNSMPMHPINHWS